MVKHEYMYMYVVLGNTLIFLLLISKQCNFVMEYSLRKICTNYTCVKSSHESIPRVQSIPKQALPIEIMRNVQVLLKRVNITRLRR